MATNYINSNLGGKYNGQYAVIKTHSFDPEIECSVFDSYESATHYLQQYWEDYYNTELAQSSCDLDECMCFHEDDYGKVTWANGDYTEFALCAVTAPIIPGEWEH